MAMSREIDIPIVICNDAHYAYEKDAEYHRYLYLIATHKTLADKVEGFKEKGYWLKSTKEMAESFLQFHPQLIQDYRKELISGMEMTQEITNQCTATLTIRDIQVPKVSEDPDKLLIDLTAEGWKKKIVPLLGKVDRDMYYCRGDIYQERVRRELKAIQEYGVSGYFLVIKDLVDYAKSVGIQTGYGRGSVAGSLVAYLLDITEVDPLKFDLLFERFLSPGREGVELPDIDLDFEHTRRDELIAYLGKRWGEANVANIVTYNHMGARQALKDVGGIFGHTTKDMNEVTSSIGVETLEEALVGNLILLEFANKYPEEIRVARALEGRIKSVSRHAAGVVVSPVSLIEVCPLMRATGGDHIITQWDMHSVAKAGLIKIDVLGLKCLSVIRETVDLIKKKNPEFSISRMSISDKKVFDQFCIGRTVGIFQCERGEYQEVLRKIKPRFISDLALVTSLVRPGSKEQIDSFIDNRKHPSKVVYPSPILQEVLSPTHGILIYQEQVISIVQKMAGFTPSEANEVRKAVGKKDPELMKSMKDHFIKGCLTEKSLGEDSAERLWELIEVHAGYGFNKSHAIAYSMLSYLTMYLKLYFPGEYMVSSLRQETDDKKIERLANESNRIGVNVGKPDLVNSGTNFTLVEGERQKIVAGLLSVRGIGEKKAAQIIEWRKDHRDNFMDWLVENQRGMAKVLAKAGVTKKEDQ